MTSLPYLHQSDEAHWQGDEKVWASRQAAVASKIEADPNSGCWLWSGSLRADGYGQISFGSKVDRVYFLAHRLAYQFWRGAIPSGLVIDHRCHTRSCINPAHLRAMTIAANVLDENSSSLPAINRRKTHCKHGHEFTPENTSYRRAPWRECIQCHEARFIRCAA